jgi:hypothetical protein
LNSFGLRKFVFAAPAAFSSLLSPAKSPGLHGAAATAADDPGVAAAPAADLGDTDCSNQSDANASASTAGAEARRAAAPDTAQPRGLVRDMIVAIELPAHVTGR